jgi:hypothetical protein
MAKGKTLTIALLVIACSMTAGCSNLVATTSLLCSRP